MSFLQQYKCEYCGEEVWAKEAPEECACGDYEYELYSSRPQESGMSNAEKKARYAEQYKLNGYSWLGNPPRMFMGAFNDYPAR